MKEKVNLTLFSFFNVFFLILISISYYIDYKNNAPILEENKSLISEKQVEEEKVNSYQLDLSTLENNIITLDNNIKDLEENKSDLEKEIKNLKNQYNKLYEQMANTPLYVIDNFPTFDQKQNYPNGCESIALYLLLKYHGVNVTPDQIINKLKLGDSVHIENGIKYGGDPEIEFVGDPRSKSGYGVYENPIIDVANQFKSGIKKATGSSLDEILNIVRSGHPVQVWASSYQRTPTKCNTWTHKASGKTITWYCNFHSLVLIGATSSKVIVSDPLTGTIVNYDRTKFENAYNFYGKRAIYYE